MNKLTIDKKANGTGTIHDIASSNFDKEISFLVHWNGAHRFVHTVNLYILATVLLLSINLLMKQSHWNKTSCRICMLLLLNAAILRVL